MYTCSECHRPIGRFDEKNPPVCPTGGGRRVARPTVLATAADAPLPTLPTAGSPTFVGEN